MSQDCICCISCRLEEDNNFGVNPNVILNVCPLCSKEAQSTRTLVQGQLGVPSAALTICLPNFEREPKQSRIAPRVSDYVSLSLPFRLKYATDTKAHHENVDAALVGGRILR